MTATPLKLGVLLPTRALVMRDEPPKDANPVLEMALRAEAAGLDSVWVGDSLSAKPRMEPLTTLAALATHTQRVRLGTAVLLGALRHPVLLAQMVGTLDLLSQGAPSWPWAQAAPSTRPRSKSCVSPASIPVSEDVGWKKSCRCSRPWARGIWNHTRAVIFSWKTCQCGPCLCRKAACLSSLRATFAPSERPSSEGPPGWATGSSQSPSRRRSSPRWDAELPSTP